MLLNCGVGEDSWESLGLQGDATSPFYRRSVLRVLGRSDGKAETPILWPPDVKSWLIWQDPEANKDWWQEEKGTTENEMVGWHHWLNGHGFEWTPGVGDGQGGLACCSSWGCKESDITEQLNWTDLFFFVYSWFLCQKVIDHMWMGLFWFSLSCSIDVCVCFNAKTILYCFDY